ncbi:MAG TPA: homoserine dehydrogenase [Terriglobia bacterium]|nr:homoserine dehydrogenase [Terriglobia bacterium]
MSEGKARPKRAVLSPSTRPRKAVYVGVIGLGTVGTGTVKVLLDHEREVRRRLGCRLELKTICSRSILKRDLSWIHGPIKTTTDWKEVLRDPEIDIIVELVGDLTTARAIAHATISAGKHLVTANKQLVAEHGMELVERSRSARVNLGLEACVAGGTPIIHAIREGLAGEHFSGVYGILNGTTNYILTEMEQRECAYQEALVEAQQKGYAEPDPTFDVEGYDARYKIAILAMVCFGQPLPVERIVVEGITRIEPVDFAYAHRLDRTIRLIAAAVRRPGNSVEIFVRPMIIPRASQLAKVAGPVNSIMLIGDKGGNTTVTGRGAGGEPTGVAILSDMVQIARSIIFGGGVTAPLGYADWSPVKIAPLENNQVATYLRLVVRDRPGILARVCSILARHRINIDSVLQEPAHSKGGLPFVMTLEPTQEKNVRGAIAEIARLSFMAQPPLMLVFSQLP